MKPTKITLFPALLALSLFGAVHAYAGNDGDMNPPPDDHVDTTNPNPDTHMPPDPETPMPPDPEPVHVDKGGNPPTPPTPPTPTPRPDPRPTGGNTDTDKKHPKRLVCVIGEQRFYVRYRSECVGPRVVYRDPGVTYTQPRKRVRTVRYAAPCNCAAPVATYGQSRGDIVIGGGYGASGSRFIGSPAAVLQARKRANRQLQYGGGYAYGGGYGYSDGGGYYEQAPVIRRKIKRLRRARVQVYAPYPVYDPGVVVHYGPAIMKDGAY